MYKNRRNHSELPQSSWCTLECIAHAIALTHSPDNQIPITDIFNSLKLRLEERYYTTMTQSGPIQLFNRHGEFNTRLIYERILAVQSTFDWLLQRYTLQYNISGYTKPQGTLNLLNRSPNSTILQFVDVIDDRGVVQKVGHCIVLRNEQNTKYPNSIEIFDPHLPNLNIIHKEDIFKPEIVSADGVHSYALTPATIIFHNC